MIDTPIAIAALAVPPTRHPPVLAVGEETPRVVILFSPPPRPARQARVNLQSRFF